MKISVLQEALAYGLGTVSRAVAPRSSLPVLANILTASDDGRLRLSATNTEMGITCWIDAKIETEGSTTIPARTFADLVGTLPKERVDMILDETNQTLHVACGTTNTDIKCIDAEEFPPMPAPDLSNGVEINVADLREMVQQVVFSASLDESRQVLNGVLVIVKDNRMTMVAADGFRLSVRWAELSTPAGQAVHIIVPARALAELARIAGDGSGMLTMVVPSGRGQVVFRAKDVELSTQLIDGSFPPYEQAIPVAFQTRTVVSTEAFLKACKQTEIFARENSHIARLEIKPGGEAQPGTVELFARSDETGSSEAIVDANIEGEPLQISFNVRYLRDVLEVIRTPNVALETNTAGSPGVIRPLGQDQFLHVIMPMQI